MSAVAAPTGYIRFLPILTPAVLEGKDPVSGKEFAFINHELQVKRFKAILAVAITCGIIGMISLSLGAPLLVGRTILCLSAMIMATFPVDVVLTNRARDQQLLDFTRRTRSEQI